MSWTPDGRYLLAASVQAQGLCSFSIIDANEKKVTPLPEAHLVLRTQRSRSGSDGDSISLNQRQRHDFKRS